MKLDHAFIQLPLKFDAERLLSEIETIEDSAWTPHPQGYAGNDAMTLITPYGINNNDELSGPMRPTDYLKRCPYLMETLQTIGGVWGRTRLMRLSGQAEVEAHIDVNYYWRERMRVHVPITTQASVRFHCGDEDINMAEGECWIFDTWRMHRVINDATRSRIHLVADTVGGERFWEMFRAGQPSTMQIPGWAAKAIAFGDGANFPLRLESVNVPNVMTPWEMREHFSFLFNEAPPQAGLDELSIFTFNLCSSWHALWIECGDAESAYPKYRQLRDAFLRDIWPFKDIQLISGYSLVKAIGQSLMLFCVKGEQKQTFKEIRKDSNKPEQINVNTSIQRPLILISAPRSGSTLLFETLEKNTELYSIGGESHGLIETITELHPGFNGFQSNVLTADDCRPDIAQELISRFQRHARDNDGNSAVSAGSIRLLEKTPKNSLRIPFMLQVFTDADFLFLHRDPRHVLASMIDAWQSGKFQTYPDLPGWTGMPWSLLLVPGWRELDGLPLHHVVAHQWAISTKIMLDDLEALLPERIQKVRYETFVAQPQLEIERICAALQLYAPKSIETLPFSKHTLTLPNPDKWKRHELLIEEIWPIVETQALRAEMFMQAH